MKKWEYRTSINAKPEELNRIGLLGWELVSVVSYNDYFLYYFKRELPEQIDETGPM